MIRQANKYKVLYVVDDVRSAQFRYRVNNLLEITHNGMSRWKVGWTLKSDVGKADLTKVDLVVILRQTDKDGTISRFIMQAHKVGVKVLFDLDDLVFDYRDIFVLMKSIGALNIAYWMSYFYGIRRIAKRVDGFICTNDFLAKKLKRSFNKPVRVIPNSLNKEQIEVSEKFAKRKNEIKKDCEVFSIGYFSGSPTHINDFRLIEGEIIDFMTKYKDVKLRVVGYMKFSEQIQRSINEKRVEVIDFVDYLKLQELMSEVDVNIAPLVINDFTNCKSELKFFEAAAVETTTIASPTYTFKKAIKDGENGFLAQPGEWYDKLEYLYKNPEENKRIAKKAREYALKHYYGKEFLEEVEKAYEYFAK